MVPTRIAARLVFRLFAFNESTLALLGATALVLVGVRVAQF